MKEIFEIIREPERENERGLRIGIRLKMAGYETLCPMSEPCRSLQDVQVEVDRLKRELDRLLDRTKGVFEGNASDGKLGVTAEMTAGQIWRLLSEVGDDEAFVLGFNGLEETRRREVAEHILARCSVFSGRGAFFSAHYDEASGLMA